MRSFVLFSIYMSQICYFCLGTVSHGTCLHNIIWTKQIRFAYSGVHKWLARMTALYIMYACKTLLLVYSRFARPNKLTTKSTDLYLYFIYKHQLRPFNAKGRPYIKRFKHILIQIQRVGTLLCGGGINLLFIFYEKDLLFLALGSFVLFTYTENSQKQKINVAVVMHWKVLKRLDLIQPTLNFNQFVY